MCTALASRVGQYRVHNGRVLDVGALDIRLQ
jgi:hypothetical protein